VYLHLGASKTGTTYLQEVLWHNRDRLRAAGTLYPGLSPDAHFRAASDLCGRAFQEHVDPLVAGAWPRLVGQARAWGGRVVVSHELFGLAEPECAARALAELSWAEVHLVCTVRDLARQIPATWQEDVKNRQVLRFGEFTEQLRMPPGASRHYLAELFWQLQDTAEVLRTWTTAGSVPVPPERVHVVTVPPRGAPGALLWQRYAEALGLPAGDCDTELTQGANASMGVAETNLLRRLNVALDSAAAGPAGPLDWPTYDVLVKDQLALYALGGRPGARPLRLPRDQYGWVGERSARLAGELGSAGYRVHGDLAELVPPPPGDAAGPDGLADPDTASDTEVLDAALVALVGLLHWSRDNRRPTGPAWRRTAVALSRRHRGLRGLHHRYLATKARLADQRRTRR
jgi:hypothetical protein